MGRWSTWIGAMLIMGSAPAIPAAAQAQADSGAVAASVAFHSQQNRQRQMEADLGLGGIELSARRIREGRKVNCELFHCGRWTRSYAGEVRGWVSVSETVDLRAIASLAHERRGHRQSPLLALGTGGLSQNMTLSLSSRRAALSLSAFDRAGWSNDDSATLAERISNGEGRARRGMALEYAVNGAFGRVETRTAIVLSHAAAARDGGENVAMVQLRAVF